MITIVTTSNSAVLRQLGSRAFARLDVHYRVATSGAELLELVRAERPAMALLDVSLPDMEGYEVCRRIKADPEIRGTRVMMVLGTVLSRADLKRLGDSNCDDVFCVPAPSDELFQHCAHLLGLALRSSRRVAVQLQCELQIGELRTPAQLVNLSRGGAKVISPRPPGAGADVTLFLRRSEREAMAQVPARVVWQRNAEGGVSVGLEFGEMGKPSRELIDSLALWDATAGDDGKLIVAISGEMTEATELSELWRYLINASRPVEFDLSQVRYVNSWGVRTWITFLEKLPSKLPYDYVRASVAFVTQAGMVPAVLGRGRLLSFYAPYHCDVCDRSEDRVLQAGTINVQKGRVTPPPFHCSECGAELAFDDVPERYFAFLQS
jgi:CheY-like chemotaxis protein